MAYELLIKNGTLIDGSGAPAFRGDVAVQDGRIAEIGRIADGADSVIDAADCTVAPGFIDPHTHYDAQICWDNAITPSSWHGVTSAVLGNCGVGIAPCLPQAREIAMRDLVNVEAIAYDVLEEGITWDWESFPEYLDAAARRGSVLNLAFLAPLTPFRHYVMGDESIERAATAAETVRIRDIIAEAMTAGAFGFSSTILNQHVGFQGRPLACRNASRDELKAYANVLKQMGKGVIEVALTRQIGVLDDEQCDTLDFLLEESGRPVTFIALFDRDDIPEAVRDTLRRAAPMIAKGARPQTSPLPLTRNINMRNPFTFAAFPCWGQVFEDTSRESQRAIYADPGFRDRFREDLKRPQTVINWDRLVLHEAQASEIRRFEGQSVAEIARTWGGDEVNAFLDVAVADNLACEYTYASFNTRPERMREMLNDPSVLLGLGDGGAHLDILCDSGYPTYLLGTWVRERQAITSEEAVRRLTSDSADMFGIRDRGRLKPGLAADICIYDSATVGSSNRGERRHDLPGGGKRMVMPSRGICYTVVNGRIVYADGALTGDAGGQVLRS